MVAAREKTFVAAFACVGLASAFDLLGIACAQACSLACIVSATVALAVTVTMPNLPHVVEDAFVPGFAGTHFGSQRIVSASFALVAFAPAM